MKEASNAHCLAANHKNKKQKKTKKNTNKKNYTMTQ
jgi:hypothetical protein